MTHVFHSAAALELEEAVRYHKQRGSDLGRRFAREVRATVAQIVADPWRWRVVEDAVRRCGVRVFPYSVLYSTDDDCV